MNERRHKKLDGIWNGVLISKRPNRNNFAIEFRNLYCATVRGQAHTISSVASFLKKLELLKSLIIFS